ncbi:hypothetical protein LTS09_005542 [Friedmanniomyces endolithicus]|nr:hypothetical protein LTS09_005542 [Friedmanniomyces endolithicus]KAK0804389.1 hypothetical protein LTR38_005802 [Friedmanniomyces endolithicus]KAK0831956.1 hypothetical protein LTR03_015296 [Friedmanniomyces endolithicus]KAK0989952.1 hypothetical protein LTS01_008742 [Friedmanniomyces endolithicus]
MANQAWQLTAPGAITLNDLETPIPKPGSYQALVRIHAVALNPGDNLLANFSDKYPVKAKLGQILATDGAGVIEEPGPHSIWKKGDRVVIHPSKWLSGPQENMTFDSFAGTTADGMLRRWLVWDDDRLFRAPSHLSLEEASTLFVAGVTAYRALFYGSFRPQPGMTVLTQGTGGVSCFAILFAKAAGMKVVATSSSDEKLEVARKLGADSTINYRTTPEWGQEARKLTGGKGVDLVVDIVGGPSLVQAIRATRFGGGIAVLGQLVDEPTAEINTSQILGGALTIFGQAGSGSKEVSDEMSNFVEEHRLRPQIARVFEWEEADQALKALERLSAPGKIVVRV